MNEQELQYAHAQERDAFMKQKYGARRRQGDWRAPALSEAEYKAGNKRMYYESGNHSIYQRNKMSRKDAKTYKRGNVTGLVGLGAVVGSTIGAYTLSGSYYGASNGAWLGVAGVLGAGSAAMGVGGIMKHGASKKTPYKKVGQHSTKASQYAYEHYERPHKVTVGALEEHDRKKQGQHGSTFHSTHRQYGTGTTGSAYYTRRVNGKTQRVRKGKR